MAVTSSEAFLQVLKKSKLLSDDEFDEVRQKYGADGDPKGIARTLIKIGKINKWQALQLLAGRYALTLSKYKLLDQIGSDQKSRVFLAEHAQMGRRVAIKTLSRQHATENPKSVKQFLDRANRLAALDHRNIVHVYDVDSEDERYYVVAEFVEGVSLKQMLDEKGKMPAETVARYVSQAAAGLAYAHKQDHVHGDLRPANLVVDGQDVVKIANLGVKGLTTSEQDDKEGDAAAAYAAPERSSGEPSRDPRSDIYSLGCVMYALLTGHPPSSEDAAQSERATEPPKLLGERPDVPEPLATVCETMMAYDPGDRYQTADEVERQLAEWMESSGVAEPGLARPRAAEGGKAASDSHPPKAAAPPPRKKPQDRTTPGRQKSSQAAMKPQAAAEAADKPRKTPVAAAKPKRATAATTKQAKAEPKSAPAAVAAGEFAINTKRRRRKGGRPAASAKGAAGTESGSIPKLAYIIGGAVAGLVLVTGLILLLMFVFSGGDDDGVEVADSGNVEAAAKGATDSTGTDLDGGANSESDPETDPETDPVLTVDTAPAPAPDAAPTTDGTGQDADMEATDNGGSVATASKPADESGPAAASKGKQKGNETPAKTSDGGTAKAPATTGKKPVEEAPAGKPAASKPAANKPPAKPPAKPAKTPFVDFPKLVTLPDLDSADALKPKSLGTIHASGELCFIKLRGGEQASKGPQSFVMRNADGGLAERDWEILWREGESGPETKIAHLSLGDNSQLSFQWQPEAKTQSLSAHLSNCALSFSCRGESHIALLRQPTRVDGMAVDLEKAAIREDWNIDMPPDPAAVRVEITGVQGGQYTVKPAATISADKGEAWIQLENGGGLLSLHVETSLKRAFQVTLTPHVKLTPDGKPQRLNVRMIQQNKAQLQQGVQTGQMMVQRYTQMAKSKQVSENQKRREIQPRLATFRSQLESAQAALQKVEDFEKMLKEVSLTLNLRVFFNAGSTEVDLLRIGG